MAKVPIVLVVDDEPPIRRFLRTSLVASDYRVIEAEDAANALRSLAIDKPDLVILDLGLPDKSGLELIGEIRRTSTVPILVLSARHDERSKVAALDLGADDYIGKPFGMAELMARLRDLVARARSGALRTSELSDPTITVTNLGERGVEAVFGVIYPPQVALVGFGMPVERPWVVSGEVAARRVLTTTLAADHRASDGHRGALFLANINRKLQSPETL